MKTNTVLHKWLPAILTSLAFSTGLLAASLEEEFSSPPAHTKPWVYWYWISDNISKEGITRDLESMARVGIGEAFVGNVDVNEKARGNVKVLTEEWWGMVEHAIREGGRLGVDIGFFNCPGWSQSGGPWIRPEQAMRYMVTREVRVQGPVSYQETLPAPAAPFQDVSLLAFPAPAGENLRLGQSVSRIISKPEGSSVDRLFDGRLETVFEFPAEAAQGRKTWEVVVECVKDFEARSLTLQPRETAFAVECELQYEDSTGTFKKIRSFTVDRSNIGVNVGPMPYGPVAVSFPVQKARRFKLIFSEARGAVGFKEIEISSSARLERYVEKQLGKMHPTPQPMWDTYLWPAQPEPEQAGFAVAPSTVINLSRRMSADGTLQWQVPAGDWVILRVAMTPTGTTNAPASPEGQGMEVDKMNAVAAKAHFNAYLGKLLARMPVSDRKAFKHVVADSYEMGSQNWTDSFRGTFQRRYGYDPDRWLPVLTGRLVGSATESERFLWDLRRLVADRVAYEYVGGLRDLSHRHGLKLWLENYGHWGFPAEFLQYGGQADQVSGEFWATGDLGSIELRAATSASHIYGRRVTSAEAFTGGPPFVSTPWSLKKRCDWAATEGINHFVFHVYIHQPDEQLPGINAWFGTEFNRYNTWFESSKSWVDYIRRTHYMLQQGKHIADVAYFIGEDAPKMTGVCQPELPPGHDFDYINAEVIERRLGVKDGRFVLPDGMAYRLLVLPAQDTMRPEVLRRLRALVAAGGCILGTPPSRSPSMEGFPGCDGQVRKLAQEIWGAAPGSDGERKLGKGRVFWGKSIAEVLLTLGVSPDVSGLPASQVLWTHRGNQDLDIYFLSNQKEAPLRLAPLFRVKGRQPEVWDPATGERKFAGVYSASSTGTRVALDLEARGSALLVFRKPADRSPTAVRVTRGSEEVLDASSAGGMTPTVPSFVAATNDFTIAVWVKPSVEIDLPKEADQGVAMQYRRNDAIFPPHGDSLYPSGGHAGVGLSVGRNGVCVFEHSGNYFAPLLAHPVGINGWTHVAIVYQDAQPKLFVNGHLLHRGLKSRYRVHPGNPGQGGPGGPFAGELGEVQQYAGILDEAQLAKLAQSPPQAVSANVLSPLELVRAAKGGWRAIAAKPGSYQIELSDGGKRSVDVAAIPAAVDLSGPWKLTFPPGMDVPEQVVLQQLGSWTDSTNPAIRHFSGTGTYSSEFMVDDRLLTKDQSVLLDLGGVESLAEVVLNGQSLSTLWKPPFRLDVTRRLKRGKNTLEVRVTNVWKNRLIGDKKYPQGFEAGKALQFKPHIAVDIGFQADDALASSGLLGPVRLVPVLQRKVQ